MCNINLYYLTTILYRNHNIFLKRKIYKYISLSYVKKLRKPLRNKFKFSFIYIYLIITHTGKQTLYDSQLTDPKQKDNYLFKTFNIFFIFKY